MLARHGEFSTCGWAILVYCAAGVFSRRSSQGNTAWILLVSTAHTSVVRGYLLSQMSRYGAACIISFGPVKRDAEKCTTGTTRHAWIQIAHNSPVLLFKYHNETADTSYESTCLRQAGELSIVRVLNDYQPLSILHIYLDMTRQVECKLEELIFTICNVVVCEKWTSYVTRVCIILSL